MLQNAAKLLILHYPSDSVCNPLILNKCFYIILHNGIQGSEVLSLTAAISALTLLTF